MGSIVMKQPVCRWRDRFVAAILALAVPSIALAVDGTICLQVPLGGSIQLLVRINDPTPIIIDVPGPGSGVVEGVALLGASDIAGTAVIGGTSLVIRTASPSTTLGLSSYPTVAIVTVAVPDQAPVGTTTMLTLDPAPPSGATASLTLDPAAPSGLNQLGSSCVGFTGPVSINDVLPGGGFVPAGSLVSVVGIGFQPGAQVLIDGVSLASTSWVDSSRIDVVTAIDVQFDGRLVSVTNPDLTGASYFANLRATDLGQSARPLLAATEAIFPVQTRSSAAFSAPTGGTFFGLALQNPGAAGSIVSVDLWNAGSVVASASLTLPPQTKVSREVSELFPSVIPSGGSALSVTATVPVQMLGLSGNENDGSVTPVLPAPSSP